MGAMGTTQATLADLIPPTKTDRAGRDEEYRAFRNAVEPPEDPVAAFGSHPAWETFLEEGKYRVDWEAVDNPRFFTAMYVHILDREEFERTSGGPGRLPKQARSIAEAAMKHASPLYNPGVIDIPVALGERIALAANAEGTNDHDKILAEMARRGFLKAFTTFGQNIPGGRYANSDYQLGLETVDDDSPIGKESRLSLAGDGEVLGLARQIVDHHTGYISELDEAHRQAMYRREHSPENRQNTLFADEWMTDEQRRTAFTGLVHCLTCLGYTPNHRWGKFLDTCSQEELQDWLLYARQSDDGPPTDQNGETMSVWMDYPDQWADLTGRVPIPDNHRKDELGHDYGLVFSRMDGDTLLETLSRLAQAEDITREVLVGAVAFAPSAEARARVMDKYAAHSAYPDDSPTITIQLTDDYDDWMETWIDVWSTRGGTPVHTTLQRATESLGANADATSDDVQVFADGRPHTAFHVSESCQRHVTRLYEETQDYYSRHSDEKWRTVYRGVGEEKAQNYLPATVESWSENQTEARKFCKMDGNNGVMKREIQLPNVLCTWESLGDRWPENDLKGGKEWMVLGAGLRWPH